MHVEAVGSLEARQPLIEPSAAVHQLAHHRHTGGVVAVAKAASDGRVLSEEQVARHQGPDHECCG